MAKKINPLIVILLVIGGIYIINQGLLGDLFTIQLSRDTVFVEDADLDDTILELRQEKDPLIDSYIVINNINPSSVTSAGASPYSYFQTYSDGVTLPTGKGACAGLSGFSSSSLDACCNRLGGRFLSDTGWNVCVTDQQYAPEYVTISLQGSKVYEWDGIDNFPQYSNDISSIVNDVCGLETPLTEREYVSPDCNHIQGTSYSDTWTKCIVEINIDSSCPTGTALIAKLKNSDLCGGSPEYSSSTPTDCFLPLEIDTGNGYGQLSLSLQTSQISTPGYVAVSREDCPEGFNELDGICYEESDLSLYLEKLSTARADLVVIQNSLSEISNNLQDIVESIRGTGGLSSTDKQTIEDAQTTLTGMSTSLASSLISLEDLKNIIYASRDSTDENKQEMASVLEDYSETKEDVDGLIVDVNSLVLELEAYQVSEEEQETTEEDMGSDFGEEESASEGETIEISTETSDAISSFSDSVSDAIDSIDKKTGIGIDEEEGAFEIFGYSIPYYIIMLILLLGSIGFFMYRKNR